MPKTIKSKSAKSKNDKDKALSFGFAELSSFKHQALKAKDGSGNDVVIKKDSIIAIQELESNGQKSCLAVAVIGGGGIEIKGSYQEVAAKLNWVIED